MKKVTLVGAGLGGKGLLTLRGLEVLQGADIVLYDRIVGDEILDLIPAYAERIDVGKSAGNHPIPQEEINTLLLEHARREKNVVRLKGGDPFVFGRGGEELEGLADSGIPFEVVPGVTSAVAAAAYAGIPVTHRECASSFYVMTAHGRDDGALSIDFDTIVKLDGTLVFLMGAAVIADICNGCINAGMDKDMPAAIVENAASNSQRKFLGTITTLPEIAGANNVQPPAVIIIGQVCRYSERYDWFVKNPSRNKRVVVARIIPGSSKLPDSLREEGFGVVEMPCLRIVPIVGLDSVLAEKLKDIGGYSWLVFTSGVGVDIFFDYLVDNRIDIRGLGHLKIACVGIETEAAVSKRGVLVDYIPAEYNGAALARGLAGLVRKGERLFIARAKDGDKDLTRILDDAGVDFDDVPIYEKVKYTRNACVSIVDNDFDFAAFTSPSGVEGFVDVAKGIDLGKVKAVCIGEKTADVARGYGMDVYVSAEATARGMVERIKELSV